MSNWLKDGLTYKPTGMSAGNSCLADNRFSDWNSASNNFCLTLTVCDNYIGRLIVRSEPTYTSSNWRVESTLSDSDTNIASNSLTSSSNVGLCIGDSCQHFNIIWYLRNKEKPKTRTICFSILPDVFFLVLPFATCTSPKTHLVCPKILHKHCFQFLLGQWERRCCRPGPYHIYS